MGGGTQTFITIANIPKHGGIKQQASYYGRGICASEIWSGPSRDGLLCPTTSRTLTRKTETAMGDLDGPGLEQVGLEECISNKTSIICLVPGLGWLKVSSAGTVTWSTNMWPFHVIWASHCLKSSEKQHLRKKQGSQETTFGSHITAAFLKGREQSPGLPRFQGREQRLYFFVGGIPKNLGPCLKTTIWLCIGQSQSLV